MLVLGALCVLVVALLMLITLNLGQAVFEKIRLQQLADTAAFSMATQQARLFNFLAYTNRANISGLVAATSAHAYLSLYSAVPGLFLSASRNYHALFLVENAACVACVAAGSSPGCIRHCGHATRLGASRRRAELRFRQLQQKVPAIDRAFLPVIQALDDHLALIAESQSALIRSVRAQLGADALTRELRDRFAPQASSNPLAVAALNESELMKVFEPDEEIIQWETTEIGNGTRHATGHNPWFLSDRTSEDVQRAMNPSLQLELAQEIGRVSFGHSWIAQGHGQARLIRDPRNPIQRIQGQASGPDGNTAASFDQPVVLTSAVELCELSGISPPFATPAWAASGPQGGDHFFAGERCDNLSSHVFQCLSAGAGRKDEPRASPCFTLFKANPKPGEDFGQPSVYVLVGQDLRRMEGGGRGPWEITSSGQIRVRLGRIDSHLVTLADTPTRTGLGLALSKALVYYHLPSRQEGWKEHPNFFNPYWKAKLQPFRASAEATRVLGAAGLDLGLVGLLLAGAPLP